MRHRSPRRSALVLAALLALGTVACGDDGPTNGETNQGTGDPGGETTTLENEDETQTTGSVVPPGG